MRAGGLILLAALPALTLAASDEHRAPVENLAAPRRRSEESARQALLAEMWQRRILSSESRSWSAEELDLLLKMRSAEELGAIALLRRRIGGPLGSLAAPFKPAGASMPTLRLTREGYERWCSYRAQDALDYFEQKGAEAGLAFRLEDLDGKRLFDTDGRLTAAGDEVYNRALANLPVWWKLPQTGEVFGTRPPSQAKAPAQAQEAERVDALPVTIGPEHAAIMQQTGARYGRGYRPEVRVAELGRLRIVMEYEPGNDAGPNGYIVIVARDKDKAAARREISQRLPQLGVIPVDKVVTVEQKLAGMEANARHVAEHTEGRVRWTIDRAAVEKQLRRLLEGKLAVAWVLSSQAPPAEEAPAPAAAEAPAPRVQPKGPPASATEAAPPEPSPQPRTEAKP